MSGKREPWSRSKENSAKSADSRTNSQHGGEESAVVFSSKSLPKSPPWKKQPVLDFNALMTKWQQKTQASSTLDQQPTNTQTSSVSPDMPQVSTNSSEVKQRKVASDLGKQSSQHKIFSKNLVSDEYKEGPRPVTSDGQDRSSSRNLSSSMPARRGSTDIVPSTRSIAVNQNAHKSNTASKSNSLPVDNTSSNVVSPAVTGQYAASSSDLGRPSAFRNTVTPSTANINSHYSHKSSSTTKTSTGTPLPVSNAVTTTASSRPTSGLKDLVKANSTKNTDVTVARKTTSVTNSSYHTSHKIASAPGTISKTSHVRSPTGQVSPRQTSGASPDQRSPVSQEQRPSNSSGHNSVHRYHSGKDSGKTKPSSREVKSSAVEGKRYSIPKVNQCPQSTASSTSTTTTNTSVQSMSISSKTQITPSTDPPPLDGDILSKIAPGLFSSSKESRPSTSTHANKAQKITLPVHDPKRKPSTSTEKVTRAPPLPPTVAKHSKPSVAAQSSRPLGQNNQTLTSGSVTDRSRHNSGHRSRHSSASTGSASPLDVQKSPTDRDVRKGISTLKTSLGIRKKSASYDPRENCVTLQPSRYPKPSPKATTTEKSDNVQAMKSSSSAPSFTDLTKRVVDQNIKSRKTAPSSAKVQEHMAKKPVVIEDPRKVTHSSKLAKGAIIAKPLGSFKIPKQKYTDSFDEDDMEQTSDTAAGGASSTKKSPEKKRHKSGKDVDKRRRKSMDSTSHDDKVKSRKVDSSSERISNKTSATVVPTVNQSSDREANQPARTNQDKLQSVKMIKATQSKALETALVGKKADNR